jgi:hypothetical protein
MNNLSKFVDNGGYDAPQRGLIGHHLTLGQAEAATALLCPDHHVAAAGIEETVDNGYILVPNAVLAPVVSPYAEDKRTTRVLYEELIEIKAEAFGVLARVWEASVHRKTTLIIGDLLRFKSV